MKKITVISLMMFLLTGCSYNRYLLTDKGRDKKFLIQTIKNSSNTGEIQKKPIIVLDGKPYRYNYELKSQKLQISKNDIQKIEVLKKKVGIEIYGDYARDGVIVLTTKTNSIKDSNTTGNSKVLILLEDKKISRNEMESINPDDIDSIEVLKNTDKIKEYTAEDYDGVIIIHMKKTP
jgi:hypothetical protein